MSALVSTIETDRRSTSFARSTDGQFRLIFPTNKKFPEMSSKLPDGVHVQGPKWKRQCVRQGKVEKLQVRPGYIVVGGCLFIFDSRHGDDDTKSQNDLVDLRSRIVLASQAQAYKDPGCCPNNASVSAVAAQSVPQWSDTELDTESGSGSGLDTDKEVQGQVEPPKPDRRLTTAFYGSLPQREEKTIRKLPPRKAKAKRGMVDNGSEGPYFPSVQTSSILFGAISRK